MVDGDAARGQALVSKLRSKGAYEAVLAATVAAGLREVTSRRFALVITEITVQRPHDGLKMVELQTSGRTSAHSTPVMVATAVADPNVVRQCRVAGVADYVRYPCPPETVLERVRRAVGRAGRLSEQVVAIAAVRLGPAARVFLETLATTHLGAGTFRDLDRSQLAVLLGWVAATRLPIDPIRLERLVAEIERTFGVLRVPVPVH